ncbi:hypothetical protein OC834_007725 [Tilletia horrida]|nr:hypothetical protein OC834_007725 [Tilletia horrida]
MLPTSAPFTRLLATILALSPLAAAYPGFPPAVFHQRSSHNASALQARVLQQTCTSNSDCPAETPLCEFPWIFQLAPYNSGTRACIRAPAFNACSLNAACGTDFCDSGICNIPSLDDINSMPCLYDVDCFGNGRCGTVNDVRADGTSLKGRCLISGGGSCSENADCQSGICSSGTCNPDPFGSPAPGDLTCDPKLTATVWLYAAATELTDGTFAISPEVYHLRYCGLGDVDKVCSQNSDCASGNCLQSSGGVLRCAYGFATGTACTQHVECQSARCASASASSAPVCLPQPVGGPCRFNSACGSGQCARTCEASDIGGQCYYASDCLSMNCNKGICGPLLPTITGTSTNEQHLYIYKACNHHDFDTDEQKQHLDRGFFDLHVDNLKQVDVDFEQGIYLHIFLLDHIVQVDYQHDCGHDYQDDDDDDFFGNEYEHQQEHRLLFLSHQQVELYHEQARLYRFFDDDDEAD